MNQRRGILACLVLAGCCLIGACSQKVATNQDAIPKISYSELTNLLASDKQVVLLDVRRGDEVVWGTIPGAKHIPIDELKQRVHEIRSGAPVVVYCASGRRALRAVPILLAAGHTTLYDFVSITNWRGSFAIPR